MGVARVPNHPLKLKVMVGDNQSIADRHHLRATDDGFSVRYVGRVHRDGAYTALYRIRINGRYRT